MEGRSQERGMEGRSQEREREREGGGGGGGGGGARKEPVNDSNCFVECHTSTSFFGAAIFLVSSIHVPLREETVVEIKVRRVEGH